ncbi:MAG: glycosyltransferase family 39 protein [Chloroflexi bacterium]|nr:glycosyltransferase family 39 protein [Chloroflexota bacterium]
MRLRTIPVLPALLAFASLARLAVAFRAPTFLEGDSQSYLLPAWDLLNGNGFNPEIRRAPLYPLFISGVFGWLGQDLDAVSFAQHLLGLATVAATYLAARRLFGTLAAVLAGLAVAISGPLLIYERYLMSEAVFTCALSVSLLSLLYALCRREGDRFRAEDGSRSWLGAAAFALAGATLALAALTRPIAQALVALALAAILLHVPRWRRALSSAAFLLLGVAVVMGPWSLRMLSEHGDPSTSGGLGRSLIARSVKYAPEDFVDWKWLSETYDDRDDVEARARMLLYSKRRTIRSSRSVRGYQDAVIQELRVSPAQADQLMRSAALEAIGRKPLEYLRDSIVFSGQLLIGSEISPRSEWKQRQDKSWEEQWPDQLDPLVEPVSFAQQHDRPIAETILGMFQPTTFSFVLLPLATLGAFLVGTPSVGRLALLPMGYVLLLIGLSAFLDGPAIRYRVPLEPALAVLAAGGVAAILRRLRLPKGVGRHLASTVEPLPRRAS